MEVMGRVLGEKGVRLGIFKDKKLGVRESNSGFHRSSRFPTIVGRRRPAGNLISKGKPKRRGG